LLFLFSKEPFIILLHTVVVSLVPDIEKSLLFGGFSSPVMLDDCERDYQDDDDAYDCSCLLCQPRQTSALEQMTYNDDRPVFVKAE